MLIDARLRRAQKGSRSDADAALACNIATTRIVIELRPWSKGDSSPDVRRTGELARALPRRNGLLT